MEQLTFLLFEYTEILLGNQKNYSDNYFTGSKSSNEALAIAFIREVAHIFLQCDNLETARLTFNAKVFQKMHLDKIIIYINVPSYVDEADVPDYIVNKVFTKYFDEERWIAIRHCERIMHGTITKFPKNYMQEDAGVQRACFCLRYFLTREYPSTSPTMLYRFSAGPEFRLWMKQHCLSNTCFKLFASPVDYMDAALPESMRSHALCLLYRAICSLSYISSDVGTNYKVVVCPDDAGSTEEEDAPTTEKEGKKKRGA